MEYRFETKNKSNVISMADDLNGRIARAQIVLDLHVMK